MYISKIVSICLICVATFPSFVYGNSLFDSIIQREIVANASTYRGSDGLRLRVRNFVKPNKEGFDNMKQHVDFFADTDTVKLMAAIIIRMEVGPFVADLNKLPYLPHGLLQPTTANLRKYNRDTSFGWFGFTFGTLADTIDLANADFGNGHESYASAHGSEISEITSYLGDNGMNVPRNQVVAFYVFYMSKLNEVLTGPVSKRSLNSVDSGLFKKYGDKYGLSTRSDSKIAAIVSFYKLYNGALDEPKIRRTMESIHHVTSQAGVTGAWND